MRTTISVLLVTALASTSFAAPWEILTVTNTGMKMNHIDGLVRDDDNDGFIYLEAHSATGDPRTQQIWRISANVSASAAAGSWRRVLDGVTVNGSGGEYGQFWVKKNNYFYSAYYGGAAPSDTRDWGWHALWTTNANGDAVVGGVNIDEPNHIKSGQGWDACGQNLGGVLAWNGKTDFVAICTDRDTTGNGEDAQVRKWQGDLATIAEAECGTNQLNYSTCVFDANGNGYFLDSYDTHTNANYVWIAENLTGDYNNVQNAYAALPIPSPGADGERPVDIGTIDSGKFAGGTTAAVSIVTNAYSERGVFLYNATAAMSGSPYPPLDITPPSYAQEWRNRLATCGACVFMSYDTGGEGPGLLRLNLLDMDLSAIGITVAPDAPGVVILTPVTAVPYATNSLTIVGTNFASTVGMLAWTNALNGASGSTPAAAPNVEWSFNAPLEVGENVIMVTGTNSMGIADNQFVTITREPQEGYGTPVITVANGDVHVSHGTVFYTLNGSANMHVKGHIGWSNAQTGVEGSIVAAASWSINNIPLAAGRNTIALWGTNWIGDKAFVSSYIIREPNFLFSFEEIGLPDDLPNDYGSTSLGSDGSNLYCSTCLSLAPFYRLPPTGTGATDWVGLADYPLKYNDEGGTTNTSTGDGFWCHEGYLYQFIDAYTDSYPNMRTTLRYGIADNAWEHGACVVQLGADAAPVVDDAGNIYGYWKGSGNIEQVTNFAAAAEGFQAGTGNACHAVDSTRGANYIYFLKSKSYDDDYGQIYRIRADGAASSHSDVHEFVRTPWQVGVGCAIDLVPAAISVTGHDELWLLRGAGLDADDEGWHGFETADIAIYDLNDRYWAVRNLTNYCTGSNIYYAIGSDMCRVDDRMFFLKATFYGEPSVLLATPFIPEPFALGGAGIVALVLVRACRGATGHVV